jgi:hypothetical protein
LAMAKKKGIAMVSVSVGHRGSLRQFHQKVLRSRMQGVDSYNSMQSLVVKPDIVTVRGGLI